MFDVERWTFASLPMTPPETAAITRRPYQNEALSAFTALALRMFALLWERQSGKSTTFSDMALYEMIRHVNRTVIYASASLLLGTEIVLKQTQRADTARQLVEKEAGILQSAADRYKQALTGTGENKLLFQTADSIDNKILPALSADDFAELFENQRLEFRVYHDRTRYSRTKVIAPNIATARSWSGTVILDEIAFIRNLKELITALLPVISTQQQFKLIYGTTPPEFDDTHYSFELLAPPAGTIFKPNAAGNWYESETGVRVHRADAYDTYLAGKKIYDLKTGHEITPDDAFKKAPNKDGHKIAHFLMWMLGGTAACDLQLLKTAQERGVGQCQLFQIDTDLDLAEACTWLQQHLDPKAKLALGLDVATTTKQKSNPSVLTIAEEHGAEVTMRAVFIWKTRDPDIARERIEKILRVCESRKDGGRPKALAIDATNEKYFAEDLRKKFRSRLPVLLVVASESFEKPGLEKPTNWKEYLGDQYIAKLNDNHLTLPPESYLRIDHRLVMKDRGRFICEPDEEGRHGDTFDANKLALHALTAKCGINTVAGVTLGQTINNRPTFRPRSHAIRS
jgi:hypothetical protein